jgi:transcription antitermination factor NusG
MAKFKVGDRVKILPGVATPFIGSEGIIDKLQPHLGGIVTMNRLIVKFERSEKRSFYSSELAHVNKSE